VRHKRKDRTRIRRHKALARNKHSIDPYLSLRCSSALQSGWSQKAGTPYPMSRAHVSSCPMLQPIFFSFLLLLCVKDYSEFLFLALVSNVLFFPTESYPTFLQGRFCHHANTPIHTGFFQTLAAHCR
jgi:hypothetical protein